MKEEKKEFMKMYQVIKGQYKGRIGFGSISEYDTIMFYPIEGKHPYRVCLKLEYVKEV